MDLVERPMDCAEPAPTCASRTRPVHSMSRLRVCLHTGVAAVHDEFRACGVFGSIRGEIDNRALEVRRVAQASLPSQPCLVYLCAIVSDAQLSNAESAFRS